MRDFKIDPYTRDYAIESGQYALDESLMNNIYLSLATRKASWPFKPKFGSELHLLQREKALDRVAIRAKEYCEQALKWILDASKAEKIDITTEFDKGNGRLLCLIEATKSGKRITYEHFVEVR